MPVQYTHAETKEKILEDIKNRGPSLPVQISRTINVSPMFASAFLSELYEEGKLRMSHMKVGSSALYIIPGQEPQLENFVQHLNLKEKEAFFLLKKHQLLDDEKQLPAIRVALRTLKDFAIPIRIRLDGELKLFWKHFLIQDSEVKTILENSLHNLSASTQPVQQDMVIKEEQLVQQLKELNTSQLTIPSPDVNAQEIQINTKKEISEPLKEMKETIKEMEKITEEIKEAKKKEEPKEIEKIIEEKPKKAKEAKKPKNEESAFTRKLKEYLESKDIEIREIILEKKKDFIAKIRLDAPFGKQEYYLVAKDKKKITEEELLLTVHKAQTEKMIALIMAPGEIDKKAQDSVEIWKNLVKFEKIKF